MTHMWNPSLYMKNATLRLQPALDLLHRTHTVTVNKFADRTVRNVLDLGCGPGNITGYLSSMYPGANVKGLDSSADMIKAASGVHARANSNLCFEQYDIADVLGGSNHSKEQKHDVIYSNAALHWLGNHETLLPSLLASFLNPGGGIFAFQMPDTREQASHTLMITALQNCKFFDVVDKVRIPRTEYNPEWYHSVLNGHTPRSTDGDGKSLRCENGIRNEPFEECNFDFEKYNIEVEHWTTKYYHQFHINMDEQAPGIDTDTYIASHEHPICTFTKATGLMAIIDKLGGTLYGYVCVCSM